MVVFKSSSINRIGYSRGPGVYPVTDSGVISIASNTTLSSATTDTLQLAYVPFGCYLSDWRIYIPAFGSNASLVFKFVDTLTAVTTYMTGITQGQGAGLISMVGAVGTTGPALTEIVNMGTIYGNTLRATGATGAPVAVWASGALLTLVCTTTSTASSGATAVNIQYMFTWTPAADMGV